jgi:pilus assembly protein CpaB
MIKKRAFFMIAASLVMGVTAAWMAGNWIQNANQEDQVQMATVIAADMGIPFGTRLERRHLRTLQMPAEYVPPGSFSSVEEVLRRVTVQPVVAGEILMQGRFVDYEDGSTLAALVSQSKRAVTVRVDDVIGVAGFLLPGNRVDVVASRREANRRAISETILRDVRVLAVDQTAATERNDPVIVRAVTLEVTPQQAEVLVRAKEEGTLQLTLRNPLDDEPVVAEAEHEVAPPPPPPAPRPAAAPRPRPSSVTVIRGTDVSTTNARS